MRNLVILAALLAIAKIGYQEYLFRASTKEVIVATYQDRAVQSCQRLARTQNIGASLSAWNNPMSVGLTIGKGNIDVYFWQINNTLWNARFRNPYLIIVAEEKPSHIFCEYDILHGGATVNKM